METASTASLNAPSEFKVPFGLIGLKHLTHFSIEPFPESPPFYKIRDLGGTGAELIVLEPHEFLEKYPLEISDEDALDLDLHEGSDALVLNIVAIHSLQPQYVTVNLAAPIVVNRSTLLGKQVLFAGGERYPVSFVLVDEREKAAGSGSEEGH